MTDVIKISDDEVNIGNLGISIRSFRIKQIRSNKPSTLADEPELHLLLEKKNIKKYTLYFLHNLALSTIIN